MTVPRAATAPDKSPCLVDPTGAAGAPSYTAQALSSSGVAGLRLSCRILGLTWVVGAWQDKYLEWTYELAPESWPRMLELLGEGRVETASIAHVAALARQSGRIDLAEDLLLQGLDGRWPLGDRRLVERSMAQLDGVPATTRACGPRIRDLFEGPPAGRAQAARWLGERAGQEPELCGAIIQALVGALDDPDASVAGQAARSLIRHVPDGPEVSRPAAALRRHLRRGRPCDCFVLPRPEQPPDEVGCLAPAPAAAHRPLADHPQAVSCRESGIVWLVGRRAPGGAWSYVVAPESWPRLMERRARGEVIIVDALRLALQARSVGRGDIAEVLLAEGLAPEGSIALYGCRQTAELVLAELRGRHP
jgi:hypothetical protein